MSAPEMSSSDTPTDNGVNVQALLDARKALAEAPEAAQFQWRAQCEWLEGTQSRSTVEGFFGLGEEQRHKSVFTFDADHPRGLRVGRPWCDAGRDRAGCSGELPDRRRRVRRPAS